MSLHSPAATAGQPTPEAGIEPDGIDSMTVLIWGAVSVLITVALIFGASALYFQAQARLNADRVIAPTYFDSEKVIGDQQGVLASYAAPAAEGQPYKVPVEVAKKIVLSELRSKK